MSIPTNPFIRGYSSLHVQRVLEIGTDENTPPIHRPLHASQAHLPDHEVAMQPCIFRDEYALIMTRRRVPDEWVAQCNAHGFVHAARYAIHAEEDGESLHLGDASSLEQANEVIRRLTFKTGFYSRCWEISSWHLDHPALEYLEKVADGVLSLAPFFHAFRLPDGIVGVKLIGTPWNDAHLRQIDGSTVAQLRREHLKNKAPESLVHVLHLAGEADVRFLVFDGGASKLDGLANDGGP